jgi:hypothetical protein
MSVDGIRFLLSFFFFSFFGDGTWISLFFPFSLASLARSSNYSMVRFNELADSFCLLLFASFPRYPIWRSPCH